jgi:F420-dependent oxidoreductase-like protein
MRIGLALPHYGFSFPDGSALTWAGLSGWARRAEDLGFDSVWVSDHFFLSLGRYGGGEERYGSVEPLTALAALAAVTDRVRLGTLVLGSGFRHPAMVAKSAVTIDLLSRGRLDLGLGAGWYEDEYRALGYDFGTLAERFSILEESVEVLTLLFGEKEPVTWQGRHFQLDEAYCRPRPAQQPRPPLLIGGKGGPRLLRLVARRADGWNTVWAWTPEDYAKRASTLDALCEREGRDPSTVRRSVGLYTVVGESQPDVEARWERVKEWVPGAAFAASDLGEWRTDKLVGTPDQILETLAAFASHGVEEMILSIGPLPFAIADEEMVDLIAEQIIPGAREL